MDTEPVLGRARGTGRFIRHFIEMIVVMMLGMCALGGAFAALHNVLFGNGFADAWRDHVGLATFAMAFNMTVPIAMILPALPPLVLYSVGVIPARGVLGLQMMLMIPAMLAAMLYRKQEYSAHRHHARWFAAAR
jgi:hypothetical protein